MELLSLLEGSRAAFAAVAFLFGLAIGSFLNVVIHRLPIIMEREWRAQCAELAGDQAATLAAETFTLARPRSRCPACARPSRRSPARTSRCPRIGTAATA